MDSGRLEAAGAAELLRQYAADRATGCLQLGREDMHARVYFRDGMVYTATAPGARARLGDRLVGAGHITDEELAATLEHQRSLPEPRRIGELLIERGLIDRETMRSFVREQSTDSVAVTLGWTSGTWTFRPGEEVPEDVPLDMSVENLVMEGARRLEEWEVIQARIGSVDAVPDFVAGDGAAELALTPDEWSMLTRIDGSSTIAEIAEEAGYSEFDAGRIIYGLLTAGIVALADDAGAPEDWGPAVGGEAKAPVVADWTSEPEPEPARPDEDEAAARWGEDGWPDDAATAEPEGVAGWQAPEPEGAYDPSEASELFGELGLGEEPRDEEPRDEEPPAEQDEEPRDEEPPAEQDEEPRADEVPPAPEPPPERPGGQVNRNELLREFAALDDPGGDTDKAPPPPPPPRPPRREGDSDKDRRKGLFGRLRRD